MSLIDIGPGDGNGDSDSEATGTINVLGTAVPGGTLAGVITNLNDPDGTPTVTYQWERFQFGSWSSISGQTSPIFNVPNDPSWVGVAVRLVVETRDPKGGTTELTSASQSIFTGVAPPDSEASGDLVIRGAREEGGLLAADFRNISDADGTPVVFYQWEVLNGSTWTKITGASSEFLAIPSDQTLVNKDVRAVVTTVDPQGGTTVFTSAAAFIVNVEDAATGTLTVSGTAEKGEILNAVLNNAVDQDGPVSITYQWQVFSGSGWVEQSTGPSLVIPDDQSLVGKTVRAVATTTDPFSGTTQFIGEELTIADDWVDSEASGTLQVLGTAIEGGSLTAALINVVDADGAVSTAYQWKQLVGSTWTDIAGSNSAVLLIPDDQTLVGKQVKVVATTTDPFGGTTAFESTPQVVANFNDPGQGFLFVDGVAAQGLMIEAIGSFPSDDDGIERTFYQWQIFENGLWQDIPDATSPLYGVPDDQGLVGRLIRVVWTIEDVYGGQTKFESDSLPILNSDDPASGALAVTGVAAEGSTLTAALTNVVDPDGTPSVTYQWQELFYGNLGDTPEWVNISGATQATFAIPINGFDSYVGKQIRVVATTLDPLGGTTEFVGDTLFVAANVEDEATGTLAVTGTAAEGASLTAALTNVVDPDGLTTTTFQWQELVGATWTNIGGATSATLPIPSDQSYVGKQVKVVATTTDPFGGTTAFTSAVFTIANVDDGASATLAVTGTAAEGGSLTAALTSIVDPDGATTTAYQWQELVGSTWTDIVGATSATLSIPGDQGFVGKQVKVVATTTDPFGGTTEFVSQTQVIANVEDEARAAFSVSGSLVEGGSFTATLVNIVDPDGPTTVTYQWQQWNGSAYVDIPGAVSPTLLIPDDQSLVGKQVQVVATTADPFGGTTTFALYAGTVANIDDEATATLGVTGTAAEGGSLTAALTGVVDPDGATTTAYRWQELVGATWTNIGGATSATLPIPGDQSYVGKQVRVVATTTDALGGTTEFASAASTIANVEDEATGTLAVTGTAAEGGSLAAALTGIVDPDGATTTAYQWQELVGATWTNIAGATSATLPIPSDQSYVGKQVRVVSTTTDPFGGTTEFTGAASTIANIEDEATAALAVTGTAAEGGSLTAALTSVVDPDGATTTAYRWQELVGATWTNIAGATSATLPIPGDQSYVGKQVRVVSTTIDPFGGTTEFTGTASTIANVNDAPVARNDLASVQEDKVVIGNVLTAPPGADSDEDGDSLAVISLSNTEGASAAAGQALKGSFGTLLVNADGSYSYVADGDVLDGLPAGRVLQDDFTYTVSDGKGGTSSATLSVTVTTTDDLVTRTLGGRDVSFLGGSSDDVANGNKLANDLYGNDGSDRLFGFDGNDGLFGGNGWDQLFGGNGNDLLFGGNGNDLLVGGAGNDVLTGGLGSDVFQFGVTGKSKDVDLIIDFQLGTDRIQLVDGLTLAGQVNRDGSTILTLSNGSTITLAGVTGVTDPAQLFAGARDVWWL